jgi:hypothetical protein
LDPNLGLAHLFLIGAYLQKSIKKEAIDEAEKRLVTAQRRVWAKPLPHK